MESEWRELSKQMEGVKWEKGVRKEREGRIGKCRENKEKKYSIVIKQNRNFIILFLDFDTFLSNLFTILKFSNIFYYLFKKIEGGKNKAKDCNNAKRAFSSKL